MYEQTNFSCRRGNEQCENSWAKSVGGGLKDRRAPWSKKQGARAQRPNRSLRLCFPFWSVIQISHCNYNGSMSMEVRQKIRSRYSSQFASLTVLLLFFDKSSVIIAVCGYVCVGSTHLTAVAAVTAVIGCAIAISILLCIIGFVTRHRFLRIILFNMSLERVIAARPMPSCGVCVSACLSVRPSRS